MCHSMDHVKGILINLNFLFLFHPFRDTGRRHLSPQKQFRLLLHCKILSVLAVGLSEESTIEIPFYTEPHENPFVLWPG